MIITPELSEAVDTPSEPIPPGVYKVRIEDAEVKQTKAGTGSYLSWKLKIFGAEGDHAKYNNWPVFYSTMTSGKGAGMLKALYKAALGQELTGQFDATELFGREVQVAIAQRRDQDGNVSRWPDVKSVKALN